MVCGTNQQCVLYMYVEYHHCNISSRVNLCGKVKMVCFDKTGTLTEDSLDLHGVKPVYSRRWVEVPPSVTVPLTSNLLVYMCIHASDVQFTHK